MNHSEVIAQVIIETVLPGTAMDFRWQQSSGSHDFNLIYNDGHIVPVEVTVSTHDIHKETIAAIRSKRKGGPFVTRKLCRQDWYVTPAPDANVKKIRQQVDAYLVDIEAEGRNQFSAYGDASESPAVARIFRDLGIQWGTTFQWKKTGQIGIALPGLGATLDPIYALQAAEWEAHKLDNRLKLGAITAPERHLFVFIERDNFSAWLAINDGSPPQKRPSLPTEITHIWAAASTRIVDQYIFWRASRSEQWYSGGTVIISRAKFGS